MSTLSPSGVGPEELLLTLTDPCSPRATAMLRAYYDDIASSYYGRPATPDEVDAAMLAEPSDDLQAEGGIFALATRGAVPVGCGGVRFVDSSTGELTRIFVAPAARRTGVGASVVGFLEARSRDAGLTTLRLDTRSDLVGARRLYGRLGYTEVAPFTEGMYTEVWLAKGIESSEDPKAPAGSS